MQVDRGVFGLFVFGAKVGKILFKYNVKPTLPYYNIEYWWSNTIWLKRNVKEFWDTISAKVLVFLVNFYHFWHFIISHIFYIKFRYQLVYGLIANKQTNKNNSFYYGSNFVSVGCMCLGKCLKFFVVVAM